MTRSGLSWTTRAAGALALLALAAGPARAARPGDTPIPTQRFVNCVSDEKIAYRPGHTGALLDAADSRRVAEAILVRYPMLARDGLAPSAVVLWHPPRGDWVYAALIPNPEEPKQLCFAAHVVADDLDLTPALMKKYFAPDAPL